MELFGNDFRVKTIAAGLILVVGINVGVGIVASVVNGGLSQ